MSDPLENTKAINIDTVQSLSIHINTHPEARLSVTGTYGIGYMDNGQFICLSTEEHASFGDNLQKIMQDYPDLYNDLKTIIYRIRKEAL